MRSVARVGSVARTRWVASSFGAAPLLALTLGGCAPPLQSPKTPAQADETARLPTAPTTEPAPAFVVDGAPFCFSGTNNYYLGYRSPEATLAVLEDAARLQLRVVRIWGFLDRGALDESVVSVHPPGHKDGVYFQYWDPASQRPAYNDGPSGLEHLDFVLHHAQRLGIKLIITLTNNWRDFGGADQYLAWYGLREHSAFYTDTRVKAAYKAWAQHLLTRQNTLNGLLYKDDPTIFAWELANEPRATGSADLPPITSLPAEPLTAWAEEMSAFIKGLDPKHMVAVGDEGFFTAPLGEPTYPWRFGVDHEALTALPHVDFGTFHLYPDHWGVSVASGNAWIARHIELARELNKPTVLEEYGVRVTRQPLTTGAIQSGWPRRRAAYDNWNEATLQGGGAASLFWLLAGRDETGESYPDYDGFTVYRGDPTAELLSNYARRMPSARACELSTPVTTAPSPFVSALRLPR